MKISSKLPVLFLLLAGQFGTPSCNGQNIKDAGSTKPEIKYRVDKKYDQNGNLISYDSSYTYSYGTNHVTDSVLSRFSNYVSPRSKSSRSFFDHHTNDSIFLFREPFNEFRFNEFFIEHEKMLQQFRKQMLLPEEQRQHGEVQQETSPGKQTI